MSASSVGTARVETGLADVIIRPRIPRAGPVVVYLHSNAGNATESLGANFLASMLAKICAIADAGYTIIAPTSSITGFGSGTPGSGGHSTCQEVLDDAIAYHRANLLGTNTPVVLVGTSGGSITALRRAGLDPTHVACVVTFLTVGCLEVVRRDDIGGNRAAVEAAYGASPYPAALPANSDPAHQMSDTVPKLLTHGSLDAYSTSSGHLIENDYATRNATFVNVSGGDHNDASISGVSTSTVVDFIRSNASL